MGLTELPIKRRRQELEKQKLKIILEKIQEGKVFEDLYSLFDSIQTQELLEGKNRAIDNITLDRYIFLSLDLEKTKKYREFSSDFIEFLSFSSEKISAFNLRKKTSQKMMSNALNIILLEKRIPALVEAWFTAPDGSLIKILIMRKILQNFFQVDPGGKNISSLKQEVHNRKKQLA